MASAAICVLAAVVLVASLLLLESYIATSGATSRWPHVRGVFRPLWFLLGPLSCLYVLRHLDRPIDRRQVLLAAVPMVGFGVWMLPYYLMRGSTKSGMDTYIDGRRTTLAVCLRFSLPSSICALISYQQIRLAEDSAAISEPTGNPLRLAWLRWLMGALCCHAILGFLTSLTFIGCGRYPAALGYTTILDIGFSAGFSSSATFHRVFKKQVGASPKEFLARTAASRIARFQSHSSA